jgi:hypothetical protein
MGGLVRFVVGACYNDAMSTTGWLLYAPGVTWINDLAHGPWELEASTEEAGGWHSAFFKRSKAPSGEVERRLRTVSGRDAIPMLACYVELSEFGYALALLRGELVARYVVNAHNAGEADEWPLEECVALHGRDWRPVALAGLAGWSGVAPRPLTANQLKTLLAGEHLFPEQPLFHELGLALGIETPSARAPQADVVVFVRGEPLPEHTRGVVAAFESLEVAARVRVDPTRPGLGDLGCVVQASVPLQDLLRCVGWPADQDRYPGLQRLVDRLFADQPEAARPSQMLVLEDSVTRVRVVVPADLPAAAYWGLAPYLASIGTSIRRGTAHHYDRQSGEWRPQPDAWQQGQLRGEHPGLCP